MRDIGTELERRLAAVATPERAEGEKRYLKSDLDFMGTTLGQVRAAIRELLGGAHLGHDELVTMADELWSSPVFERRMAAVMALERHVPVLGPDDLPLLERLIRESGT